MMKQENYLLENIKRIQNESKSDPAIIERVLFAFGLLEALRKVNLPFIFKGGTSLMLLLNEPKRLSTDIDIIVDPSVDVDPYLEKAEIIFPFKYKEEQHRKGKNAIEKRHFKFYYASPRMNNDFHIILDIVFEQNPYLKTVEKPIENSLLITEKPNLSVSLPSIECILGDKLCAFAPKTTGVPYGIGKELEIIKQMYDISTLIDHIKDFKMVKDVYRICVKTESAFRGEEFAVEDCLNDTIETCLSIISKGKLYPEHYSDLISGIKKIRSHVFQGQYTAEVASEDACKILYLSACILKDKPFEKIESGEKYMEPASLSKEFSKGSYMRKRNLTAYGYLVKANNLLNEI